LHEATPGGLQRFEIGEGEPKTALIYGYFRVSYGASIDPFASLPSPIVERFDAIDQLDHKLKSFPGLSEGSWERSFRLSCSAARSGQLIAFSSQAILFVDTEAQPIPKRWWHPTVIETDDRARIPDSRIASLG
jgi:hypothetical protein